MSPLCRLCKFNKHGLHFILKDIWIKYQRIKCPSSPTTTTKTKKLLLYLAFHLFETVWIFRAEKLIKGFIWTSWPGWRPQKQLTDKFFGQKTFRKLLKTFNAYKFSHQIQKSPILIVLPWIVKVWAIDKLLPRGHPFIQILSCPSLIWTVHSYRNKFSSYFIKWPVPIR